MTNRPPWRAPLKEKVAPKHPPRKTKQVETRPHRERLKDPAYVESRKIRAKGEAQRLREWKASASAEDLEAYRVHCRARRKKQMENPKSRDKRKVAKRRAYERNLEFINSFKIDCIRCGEDDRACLQFHHRDPARKTMNVVAFATQGRGRILEEIRKCDVLCANCHLKMHANPQLELYLKRPPVEPAADPIVMARMARVRGLVVRAIAEIQ